MNLPLHESPQDGEPLPRVPDREIYTPTGGPPGNASVSRELYGLMGEEAVRTLIRDFYARLTTSEIAGLFPKGEKGVAAAAERSADFFVFLFGGPPLYQQRRGRPMMRARHLPFEIDENARRVWLDCFGAAVDGSVSRGEFPQQHAEGLMEFLTEFSAWMVNVAPSAG